MKDEGYDREKNGMHLQNFRDLRTYQLQVLWYPIAEHLILKEQQNYQELTNDASYLKPQ